MSKKLKVVYENIKTKYKVVPKELVIKPKYNRAKKRAEDIELTRDYIGRKEEDRELAEDYLEGER